MLFYHYFRNQLKFNAGIDEHSSPTPKVSESQLTEDVLKSLFNMPTPKSAEHEPNTMNWRNVVTKIASFRPKPESSPGKSVAADLYDPGIYFSKYIMVLLGAFTMYKYELSEGSSDSILFWKALVKLLKGFCP